MKYEIKGAPLPVVECYLEAGEKVKCESGAMSWMSSNLDMETVGGGAKSIFTKAFSGENLFHNVYTAKGGAGSIAFASSFPGDILALEVRPGQDIICQKSAFLASTEGVDLSIFFHKKFGAGFFGGEGFIMQRLSGNGTVFIEIDGSTVTKELKAGETMMCDTGHIAMMDSTCSIDVQAVKGMKNIFLGGEGLFNTVITGPGRVVLQTMPASQLAQAINPYIITGSSK